ELIEEPPNPPAGGKSFKSLTKGGGGESGWAIEKRDSFVAHYASHDGSRGRSSEVYRQGVARRYRFGPQVAAARPRAMQGRAREVKSRELVKLTDLGLAELEEQNLAAFGRLRLATVTKQNMLAASKPAPSQSVRILIMSLQRLLDLDRNRHRNLRIRTRPLRNSVTAHREVCRLQGLLFELKHNGHG